MRSNQMEKKESWVPSNPVEHPDRFDGSDALYAIAEHIDGAQVWHSGGGLWGILIENFDTLGELDHEIFFGFSDDVLGWDISVGPECEYIGGGTTDLTLDQTHAVITRCKQVIATKEIQ
jgi:hypothetical protein